MKKQVLVTGGTGLVGANLVKHLNQRGMKPRVLLRKTSRTTALEDLDWEPRYGDVTEIGSLERAVEGCDWVLHAAAVVSFWKKRWDEVMRVNVEGTRALLEVSRQAGVRKFVLTSSMAAVGFARQPGGQVDERSPWNYEPYGMVYHTSKKRSEELVLAAASADFQTFAINPGLVFGERDVNLGAARYFKYLERFPLPFTSRGRVMVSDADDVAEAHILAAEKGRAGERYIVASGCLSYLELQCRVAEIVGRRPPRWIVPAWAVQAAGRLGEILGRLTGWEPVLTTDMAIDANVFGHASSAKAQAELGLEPTPVGEALAKSYRWVADQGLV